MTCCSLRRAALSLLFVSIMTTTILSETHAAFTSLPTTAAVLQGRRTTTNADVSTVLPLTRPVVPPTSSLLSSSSTSSSSSSDSVAVPVATTTTTTSAVETVTLGWKGKLLKVSDIASMICVLDCTVLPLVTVVLPLFGWVAASPAQMEFLHHLGHSLALWFVLPVGGSATILNYRFGHGQVKIATLGFLGWIFILAANAPHGLLHAVHDSFLAFAYPLLHAVHHGITHRLVNLLGCACLLGSNYLSKQSGKCLHGHDHSSSNGSSSSSECGHDHGHHGHDHHH